MIEVEQLSKHFQVRRHHRGAFAAVRNFLTRESRSVKAVDGVTFRVAAGEIVGYLGPNGAGKSTTIKMLTGLLVPSGGRVVVDGRVPWRERRAHVARIGVVFGQRTTLWWDLPVIESLELLRHVYRVPATRFRHNLAQFTELLELHGFLGTPVRSLSLGQRMRADLAAALLHDPQLLVLDEPTIGLDVVAKERIRAFVAHVNRAHGTTVLLTTHDLADVQRLCPRVMIIDRGQLLFDGAPAELTARFGGERQLIVEFAQPVGDLQLEGARVVDCDGLRATLAFRREQASAAGLIQQLSARYAIRDLSVLEPDIEGTVRAIYERQLLGGHEVPARAGGRGAGPRMGG